MNVMKNSCQCAKGDLTGVNNLLTNYFTSTKISFNNLILTQKLDIDKNPFNASFFDISNNFINGTKVKGLQPTKTNKHSSNKFPMRVKRKDVEKKTLTKTSSVDKIYNLPTIKIKNKNGYFVDLPMKNDYCFKPTNKNFQHELVKLNDKVYNLINKIHNKYKTSSVLMNAAIHDEAAISSSSKDYYRLLLREKENQGFFDHEYKTIDSKKSNLRSKSYISKDDREKIEEKLDQLDELDYNELEKGNYILENTKENRLEAATFQNLYLKSSQKYSSINNRLTYPSTFKDSPAINYLFQNNIDQMAINK